MLGEARPEVTVEKIQFLSRDFRVKAETPFVDFPGKPTIYRALLHSFMSGQNSYHLNVEGFSKSLQKFGIDSPVSNVTKRLSYYGNE
jgi:hypothetical protein